MIIAVDFDGTIVTHDYPIVGSPVPHAIEILKEFVQNGHRIILYTMRSKQELADAVEYMEKNNVKLFAVNENPTQKEWTTSPKIYAHVYIDDAACGCPLIYGQHKRPYVDWITVKSLFERNLKMTLPKSKRVCGY